MRTTRLRKNCPIVLSTHARIRDPPPRPLPEREGERPFPLRRGVYPPVAGRFVALFPFVASCSFKVVDARLYEPRLNGLFPSPRLTRHLLSATEWRTLWKADTAARRTLGLAPVEPIPP